jgi:hypothetical protein
LTSSYICTVWGTNELLNAVRQENLEGLVLSTEQAADARAPVHACVDTAVRPGPFAASKLVRLFGLGPAEPTTELSPDAERIVFARLSSLRSIQAFATTQHAGFGQPQH